MKKLIALILCLVMAISLVACGGKEITEGNSEASVQTDEENAEGESQSVMVAGDAPSSNDSEETTEIEELIIDEGVKPENYILSDSGEDYETYTLENIPYKDVMYYKNKLIEKGFYIQSYSMGSEIEADTLAYEIKYKFQYAGTESIISFSELERRAKQGMEDPGVLTVTVRARDLSGYNNLPEFSEGGWKFFDNDEVIMCELVSTVNCSKEERKTTAKNYVELLKANGYSLKVEEYPDGKELSYTSSHVPLYNFYAEDDEGCIVKVYVYEDLAFPYTQAGVNEWAGIEITFEKAKKEETAQVQTDSVLPELPEGEWNENQYSNGSERVAEYNLLLRGDTAVEKILTLAKDYVEALNKNGYNLEVEEYPEGYEGVTNDSRKSIYYFTAKDASGAWVCVSAYVIPYTVETPAPLPAQIFIALHNPL